MRTFSENLSIFNLNCGRGGMPQRAPFAQHLPEFPKPCLARIMANWKTDLLFHQGLLLHSAEHWLGKITACYNCDRVQWWREEKVQDPELIFKCLLSQILKRFKKYFWWFSPFFFNSCTAWAVQSFNVIAIMYFAATFFSLEMKHPSHIHSLLQRKEKQRRKEKKGHCQAKIKSGKFQLETWAFQEVISNWNNKGIIIETLQEF